MAKGDLRVAGRIWGEPKFHTRARRGAGSGPPTVTKELAVTAGDHRAGAPQEGHDGMASRGRLPFVAGEAAEIKDDLGDFLLGGAVARSVESPQHPAQARALLSRQTGVRRDGAAVKGGEKAVDSLQPIEAIDAEGNDGGERFSARNSIGQRDLSALTLAKIMESACRLAIGPFGAADDARREFAGRIENSQARPSGQRRSCPRQETRRQAPRAGQGADRPGIRNPQRWRMTSVSGPASASALAQSWKSLS